MTSPPDGIVGRGQKRGPRLVFHIGMPKSGSTYLQREIFPRLDGVLYVGSDLTIERGSVEETAAKVADLSARSERCTALFSYEFYCGVPSKKDSYGVFAEFLDHLALLCPGCTIGVLFVIRRQDDFVNSIYRHHVRKGGSLPFERFFLADEEEGVESDKLGRGSVHHSYCNYARFISLASTHANVEMRIVPLEVMKQSTEAFIGEIACFIGVEWMHGVPASIINRGPSRWEFSIHRAINELAEKKILRGGRFFNGLDLSVRIRVLRLALHGASAVSKVCFVPAEPLDMRTRARILDMYQVSNQELATHRGYDLKQYGYY